MKKLVLPFCAVILFATQAPVANASSNAIEGGKSTPTTNHIQLANDYNIKLNNFYKLVKTTPQNWTVIQQEGSTNKDKKPASTDVSKETSKEADKETNKEISKEVEKEPTNVVNNETPKAPTTESPSQTPATQSKTEQAPAQEQKETTVTDQILAIEEKVVALTNAERAKNGLSALQIDHPLMAAAREKSQDMKDKNYFSHTSPTFGSPFDRLKALGIAYKSAGENIAKGQKSPEEVVQAWMNSEGHRANILNKDFTHIGVGYVQDGNIWTQQFIKK
ncbi:CAP domain-containing protein [Solibacillus isronensis]|uniref:CAP domain-containing protein n=1 Tax=Solibacillus isronensis TaxID=412383 RepID=UPI00203E5BDE|nr:CAP domain-containing protein [Solibacillus isronensis]MCM3721351.1 CAP domain-containing protein [Solibacillus isronensis]